MKVFCNKMQKPVDFGAVCVNCPDYEECPDRPGAERTIAITVLFAFLTTIICLILLF